MEDLVFNCFNREGSQVKGFVVAGGVLLPVLILCVPCTYLIATHGAERTSCVITFARGSKHVLQQLSLGEAACRSYIT